jgi:hypothetical protein
VLRLSGGAKSPSTVREVKMKKLLLIFVLCMILISIGCGGILRIDNNVTASNLRAGQIYGTDFILENDYFFAFCKTINLETFSLSGTTAYYQVAQSDTVYTPYFAWVCYPQITKSSQATIIFMEDVGGTAQISGDFTVRAVARVDTSRALVEFGGTYGTNQNGW